MFLFQILQRFAIVDLSNFYLDVAKDRLYVGYGFDILFIGHLITFRYTESSVNVIY